MEEVLIQNYNLIKNSQAFKNLGVSYTKKFPQLKKSDILADLETHLFLDLHRRADLELLDTKEQATVRMNVNRNYNAQLLNEKGIYLRRYDEELEEYVTIHEPTFSYLAKEPNKTKRASRWVRKSIACADPIMANVEDEVYKHRLEDLELMRDIMVNLTPKEQERMIAFETAKDGVELAELMGTNEVNARKIKERLSKKVKEIMREIRQEDVQQAC